MTEESNFIRSKDLLAQGFETLKRSQPQALWVILLGMVVPQVMFTYVFNFRAAEFRSHFVALTSSITSQMPAHVTLFSEALTGARSFFSQYMVAGVAVWFVFLIAYLCLVRLALNALNHRPQPSLGEAVWSSTKLLLPRGILLTILVLLVAAVGQVFVAAALVLSILALMVPVLLVAENRGAFSTFRRAIMLRYARDGVKSGWSVFFALMTIGGMFYVLEFLLSLCSEWILTMDSFFSLPRGPWTQTFSQVPFGWIYVGTDLCETILGIALVAVLPGVTAVLYHLTRPQFLPDAGAPLEP